MSEAVSRWIAGREMLAHLGSSVELAEIEIRRKTGHELQFIEPALLVKGVLENAPRALRSRINTWAKKYKIAPRGEVLPEVRAMVSALFVNEGLMEIRAQIRDLLSQCAQSYRHWPLHKDHAREDVVVQTTSSPVLFSMPWMGTPWKRGWAIVLGISYEGDTAWIDTHLGEFGLEASRKDVEEAGFLIQPRILSDMEVARLRFLLELVVFAAELGLCEKPAWDLFEQGSLDLNVYDESDDWLVTTMDEDRRRQAQLDQVVIEKLEAEEIGNKLAEDPDYVPEYTMGYQEGMEDDGTFEKDVLYGAMPLREPNAKEQNLDQRTWMRFDTDKLDLDVYDVARNGDWAKVRLLTEFRNHKSFYNEMGEEIHYVAWNKAIFRRHWLISYTDRRGKAKLKVHPDFHRLLDGAVRYALECTSAPISIVHKVDGAVRTIMTEDGETTVPNKWPRYRWLLFPSGNIAKRRVPKEGLWKRCFQCEANKEPKGPARRRVGKFWESLFYEAPHADVCGICGSEQQVVDAYVYVPIEWFADMIRVEALPRSAVIRVPIFGKRVLEAMRDQVASGFDHRGFWCEENGWTWMVRLPHLHTVDEPPTWPTFLRGSHVVPLSPDLIEDPVIPQPVPTRPYVRKDIGPNKVLRQAVTLHDRVWGKLYDLVVLEGMGIVDAAALIKASVIKAGKGS